MSFKINNIPKLRFVVFLLCYIHPLVTCVQILILNVCIYLCTIVISSNFSCVNLVILFMHVWWLAHKDLHYLVYKLMTWVYLLKVNFWHERTCWRLTFDMSVHEGETTIYKHTHKTKDRVTRTPLKTGGERCICMREMNLVFRAYMLKVNFWHERTCWGLTFDMSVPVEGYSRNTLGTLN
jgi:hypothetical protein